MSDYSAEDVDYVAREIYFAGSGYSEGEKAKIWATAPEKVLTYSRREALAAIAAIKKLKGQDDVR